MSILSIIEFIKSSNQKMREESFGRTLLLTNVGKKEEQNVENKSQSAVALIALLLVPQKQLSESDLYDQKPGIHSLN